MVIVKTCPHCGAVFKTEQPHAIFCSTKCKSEVANIRRRDVRKTPKSVIKAMNNEAKTMKANVQESTDTELVQVEPLHFATLDFETDPFLAGREVAPFAYGLLLESGEYFTAWENDRDVVASGGLIKHLLVVIDSLPNPYIIYAHNGGRFDFLFMLNELYGGVPTAKLTIEPVEGQSPKIKAERQSGFFMIGNRVTRIEYKHHQLRDSYSIMPVPLKSGGSKMEIDYAKMEKVCRLDNRAEIDLYLKQDCVALLEMVKTYRDVFATKGKMPLTMAGAAFKELKRTLKEIQHANGEKGSPFDALNTRQDAKLRSFYVGGRTQPFFSGIVHAEKGQDINLFDVNSEYPSVMKFIKHPIGNVWYEKTFITDNTFFIEWRGRSYGAMPVKTKTGVDFPNSYGVFKSTIHEYTRALELGLIEVNEVIVTHNCDLSTNFERFVDEFFAKRLFSAECETLANQVLEGSKLSIEKYRFLIKAIRADGVKGKITHKTLERFAATHKILVLFWKLVLNSSYGKWGQNAENFGNYHIVEVDSDEFYYLVNFKNGSVREIDSLINGKRFAFVKVEMDSAELSKQAIYNVATAASITGAARALLMTGINACNASDASALYVDTDSVFSFGMPSVKSADNPNGLNVVKDKTLGAWNHEASGKIMVLAGKKQYALFDKRATEILENPALLKAFKQYKFKGEKLEAFACRFSDKELGLKAVKGFADIPMLEDEQGNVVIERWACNKLATKGTRASAQEMVNLAYDSAATSVYHNFAPTFDLSGNQSFISRTIRNTSKDVLFKLGKSLKKVPVIAKGLKAIYNDEMI